MASLTIDLPPELNARLEAEARKRGQPAAELVRCVLEEQFGAPPAETGKPAWEGLPRRAPEDLDALALSQGAPLAVRFEDLIGDFWPEDETSDQFIAAVREWRREGRHGPKPPAP